MVTGKTEWDTSTVDPMLSNWKHVGQVLIQKCYIPDSLPRKKKRIEGSWRCALWRMLMSQSLVKKYLIWFKNEGMYQAIYINKVDAIIERQFFIEFVYN